MKDQGITRGAAGFLAALLAAVALSLALTGCDNAPRGAVAATAAAGDAGTSQQQPADTDTKANAKATAKPKGTEEEPASFEKPLEGAEREAAIQNNGEQLVRALKERVYSTPMTFDGSSVFGTPTDEVLKKVGADYIYPTPYPDPNNGGSTKGAIINNVLRDPEYADMVYDYFLYRMDVGEGSGIYLIDLVNEYEPLNRQLSGMIGFFESIESGKPDKEGAYGAQRTICTHPGGPDPDVYYTRSEFRKYAEQLAALVDVMIWDGPIRGQTVGNYRMFRIGDYWMWFPVWCTEQKLQYEGDFVRFAFYWKGFGSLDGGIAASYVHFNVYDRRIANIKEVAKKSEAKKETKKESKKETPTTPTTTTTTTTTTTEPDPDPEIGHDPGIGPAPEIKPDPDPEDDPEPQKNVAPDPVNQGNAPQGGGNNQPSDGAGTFEPAPSSDEIPAEQHYPDSAAVAVDDRGDTVDAVEENQMNDSLDYAPVAEENDNYVDSSGQEVEIPTEGGTEEQDAALVGWDPSSV